MPVTQHSGLRGPLRLVAVALGVVIVGWLSVGAATARATTFSNTASIALRDPNFAGNPNCSDPAALCNATAGTYPSAINVSGLSGTVSSVSLSLDNVSYAYSDDIDALLVGPSGANLIVLAAVGPNTGSSEAASNSTLTISDSGTLPTDLTPWGSAPTFKPVNFGSYGLGNAVNGFNETYTSPAPSSPWGDPGQHGTNATLANTFDGSNPNGTWSLYVITTSGGDGTGSIAGGWTLNITTASAAATTTALTSSNNPSFTSGSGSSVTLTATVSSTSTVGEGTVDFTDGGVTISGCGAAPVSNGTATCATSFSSEGDHSLEALYSGTSNFGASNGTLTQHVDDHTTVSGSSFCNAGSIALNNPAVTLADASPYPSHIFVSGKAGNLTGLTVTLKGVTYGESQDIDALLVGPGGQSLILVADAGPDSNGAISNVTLTLDDAAASTLSQSAIWGPANSTVTSKPFNYGGLNETFGSPAPSGPYGNPGPNGGGTATLGSTFDGTGPNGTWSLYVITTAAGDGTGSIAGGWCVTPTVPKTTLTVGTQVSPTPTTIGNSASDTATLSGVPNGAPAPTGTVTFNAYGPGDATCSNTPAFTDTVTLAGAGTTASSGAFTATAAGTYRWTASYGGDANYSSVATNCNDSGETLVVTQATPSLATTASPDVTIGGDISDSAVLSGGDNPTGTITFDVYGPNDLTCSNAPAFTGTVTVNGNGTYASADFTPTAAGSYEFVATYNGDANNAAAGGSCGSANESVVVTAAAPTLTTTASPGVAVGGDISDSAVLSGGDNPTGTITFDVYGPNDLTCSNAPAFTGTVTVNGNGTYASADFTPTAAGSYEFVATYNGDANNAAAGGSCGSANESVVVGQVSPTLSSQASSTVPAGGQISDSATLAGGHLPTGSITFHVYGPNDLTCSDAPVFTDTVTVNGNGTYASSAFTTTAVGTYEFVATYSGDANNAGASAACGSANESVVVVPASPTLSSQASSTVPAGGQISDSATLAGGSAPSGSITFTLFGPNNSACTGTPIFTSTVSSVNGNGSYPSQAFTASSAGTYDWVVTYSGDANNAGASAACGSANESVAVTPAATQAMLVSSLNPAVAGQAVTFTATVAGTNPTGTVSFMDGSSRLGTGTLGAGGAATFTTSSLSAASHSITAVYGGDANNAGSTSNAVTEVVNALPKPGAPSVSITSPASGKEYRFGQVVRADYSCSDGANGTGIQSCTGPVPSGSPIDTSTPGSHSFAVTALSKDGQSTTRSVEYKVSQNNQFTVSDIIARANGTVTFEFKVPNPGVVDVLETAWFSNLAHVTSLLQPAQGRFVFARAHVTIRRTGSLRVAVTPNSAGRKLLGHHTYSPVLRLWLSFTPKGGAQWDFGFYGLHLPTSPSLVEKCVPLNMPDRITHEPLRCDTAPAHDARART